MNVYAKSGTVVAGYVAALALAAFAVYLQVQATAGNPDYIASNGMYAFGEGLLFLAVFTVAALFPTALALHYLRTVTRFWNALTGVALAIVATAIAAGVLPWAARFSPALENTLHAWTALAILRLIIAPLFALAFAVCAAFAAAPRPRRLLALCAVIECLAAAPWFLLLLFNH